MMPWALVSHLFFLQQLAKLNEQFGLGWAAPLNVDELVRSSRRQAEQAAAGRGQQEPCSPRPARPAATSGGASQGLCDSSPGAGSRQPVHVRRRVVIEESDDESGNSPGQQRPRAQHPAAHRPASAASADENSSMLANAQPTQRVGCFFAMA